MEYRIPYSKKEFIPIDAMKFLHKSYWEFIANSDNLKRKPKIFGLVGFIPLRIALNCFACEYAIRKAELIDPLACGCSYCPIKGFGTTNPCFSEGNLYGLWCSEKDDEKARELALKIAALEWEDTV